MSQDLPAPVARFLAAHIDSLDKLEILLLLFRDPARAWSVADVTSELRLSDVAAGLRLEALWNDSLIARDEGTPPRYCFRLSDPALHYDIRATAETYKERRLAVTSFIFSRPIAGITEFADAFRFKKGK